MEVVETTVGQFSDSRVELPRWICVGSWDGRYFTIGGNKHLMQTVVIQRQVIHHRQFAESTKTLQPSGTRRPFNIQAGEGIAFTLNEVVVVCGQVLEVIM